MKNSNVVRLFENSESIRSDILDDFEECVLTLLVDDERLFDHLRLKDYHFYSMINCRMFAIILSLKEEGHRINIDNLRLKLSKHEFEWLSETMIAHVDIIQVSGDNLSSLDRYQSLIIENYATWKADRYAEDMEEAKALGRPLQAIIDRYNERERDQSECVESQVKSFSDLHKEIIETAKIRRDNTLQGISIGIKTGFLELDELLRGGFSNSHFYILGARPSVGKTALGINMALHASRNGSGVAFFSLEMSGADLVQRAISGEVCVPSIRYHMGTTSRADIDLLESYDSSGIKLYLDQRSATIDQLRDRCVSMKQDYEVDLIIVDYLGLIGLPNVKNPYEKISFISGKLKGLAKELNLPLLVLAQLNRALEGRDNKHPQLSDLRDSGSIEQDADVVMFIHRDKYFDNKKVKNPFFRGKKEEVFDEKTEEDLIIVAKNRHGPTGRVKVVFDENLTKFRSV